MDDSVGMEKLKVSENGRYFVNELPDYVDEDSRHFGEFVDAATQADSKSDVAAGAASKLRISNSAIPTISISKTESSATSLDSSVASASFSAIPGLPEGWSSARDQSGRKFYYNVHTLATSFLHPTEIAAANMEDVFTRSSDGSVDDDDDDDDVSGDGDDERFLLSTYDSDDVLEKTEESAQSRRRAAKHSKRMSRESMASRNNSNSRGGVSSSRQSEDLYPRALSTEMVLMEVEDTAALMTKGATELMVIAEEDENGGGEARTTGRQLYFRRGNAGPLPYLDCALTMETPHQLSSFAQFLLKKRILENAERALAEVNEVDCDTRDGVSFYNGLGGLAYMFDRIARFRGSLFSASLRNYYAQACTLTLKRMETGISARRRRDGGAAAVADNADNVSFHHGDAGVFALLASLVSHYPERGIYVDHLLRLQARCVQNRSADSLGSEMSFGRASYLFALLFLQSYVHPPEAMAARDRATAPLFERVLRDGLVGAAAVDSEHGSPLVYEFRGKRYFGAAHGIAGVVHVLLHFPQHFMGKPAEQTLRDTIDYLISQMTDSGGFRTRPGKGDALVQFCHGAPGFVMVLCKAYRVLETANILEAACRCGDFLWERGLITKGIGLCHGIIGNAYPFLSLYRVTNDPKWLFRACRYTEFSWSAAYREHLHDRVDPVSLYAGLAGVTCFYLDLIRPQEARFPGFEVE